MQNLKISFIGGGNMAEALIAGLTRAGHDSGNISVSDTQQQRLDNLHAQYRVHVNTDNTAVILDADVVLLAVKPQQMNVVLSGIADTLKAETTLISIAAGVNIEALQRPLGSKSLGLVRVMPNTPALVGAGMSVLFSNADALHKQKAEYILASSGETAWVDEEKQLHAVTALSGSGPAYFFLLAELMQAAGESLGLSKDLAAKLAAQTAMGSGKMLIESGREASDLRAQVSSPGGTTQAALDEMYECGLPAAVRKGMNAAHKRSKELAG